MSQGKSCSDWASIGLLGLRMVSRIGLLGFQKGLRERDVRSWASIGLLGLRMVSRMGLLGLRDWAKHRAVRVKNGLKDRTARVEYG